MLDTGMGSEVQPVLENVDQHEQQLPSEATTQEILERNVSTATPAVQEKNPERKLSAEDPSAIIDSLRARLLFERNSSKNAKQQAQQFARKVKELEHNLVVMQKINQKLLAKLQEAGITVDIADEKEETKPNWRISRRSRSSDGNMEGAQHGRSSSPRSESGSSTQRRAGRSCRTIRNREPDTSEMGIDEQVKGTWSKVGEDIVELAKLRDGDCLGAENGWVSRVVDLFECKNDEEKCSEYSDEAVASTSNSVAQTSQPEQNVIVNEEAEPDHKIPQQEVENRDAQEHEVDSRETQEQEVESFASTSETDRQEKSESTSNKLEELHTTSAGSCEDGNARKYPDHQWKQLEDGEGSTSHIIRGVQAQVTGKTPACNSDYWGAYPENRPKVPENVDEDVEDILRALTLAKQQLRRMQPARNPGYIYNNYGYPPGYDVASFIPQKHRQQQDQYSYIPREVPSYVDKLSFTRDVGYFSPSRC